MYFEKKPRRRRVIEGMAASYSAIGIQLVLNLVMTPLALAYLGKDALGLWYIVGEIAAYALLIETGTSHAAMRFTALWSSTAPASLRKAILTLISCNFAFALPISLFLVFFGYLLADFFEVSTAKYEDTSHIFQWLALWICIRYTTYIFPMILRGLQLIAFVNYVLIGASIMRFAVLLALIKSGFGVEAFIIAEVVSHLLQFACACIGLHLHERNEAAESREEAAFEPWRVIKYAFNAAVIDLSDVAIYSSTSLIIGKIWTAADVAAFNITVAVAKHLRQLLSLAGTVFLPGLTEILGKGDRGKIEEIYLKMLTSIGTAAAIALCGYVLLNERFVALWVGRELFVGEPVTLLFALWAFVMVVNHTNITMMRVHGELSILVFFSYLEAGLLISLAIYFGQMFGLVGVPLGCLCASLTKSVYTFYWIGNRYTISAARWVRSIAAVALAVALMGVSGAAIREATAFESTVAAFLAAAVPCGIVALLAWLAFGLETDERKRMGAFIQKRFGN